MPRFGKSKHPPVSWSELPHKGQLLLLVLARFSEPLTMSSIRSYMYYQLKSFDSTLSDATISTQAGYIQSAFIFAQFLTAIAWGKAADSEYFGRKRVLMIGLMGTSISVIGFGFSTTFWQAIAFRILGGMLNGNVGVMRTMVSERIKEKKYQSRAFMLMPMTGNIGQIIGPMVGGFLADPVTTYPNFFGPGSFFGRSQGVQWMMKYPYALPNIVAACFLMSSALVVLLGLEETHHILQHRPDWGIGLRQIIIRKIFRNGASTKYMPIPADDSLYNPFSPDLELETTPISSPVPKALKPPSSPKKKRVQLPFKRIFTRNVVITLFSRGLLAMHIGTFGNLWYIFLSTPRDVSANTQSSGFHFNGGLGLPPSKIGIVLSIIGGIGIAFQLIIYPAVSQHYGTVLCYRTSLLLFPAAYFLAPFLAVLPSSTLPPLPASGVVVWAGLLGVLFIHTLARTFAMPSATILVNNCCPHPSVLSTLHGVAQSVSSGMRMLGPIFGGWGLALGLQIGLVGLPFWVVMILSGLACVLSLAVREGDGHEIKLEGEEEEMAEEEKPMVTRSSIEIVISDVSRREHGGSNHVRTP